jgi:hypothetical protein
MLKYFVLGAIAYVYLHGFPLLPIVKSDGPAAQVQPVSTSKARHAATAPESAPAAATTSLTSDIVAGVTSTVANGTKQIADGLTQELLTQLQAAAASAHLPPTQQEQADRAFAAVRQAAVHQATGGALTGDDQDQAVVLVNDGKNFIRRAPRSPECDSHDVDANGNFHYCY